jgi:hypothetical protein
VFQGGERLCLLQLGLFRCIEEQHVSLQKKSSVLKAGEPSTLFPFSEFSLFFKGILSQA